MSLQRAPLTFQPDTYRAWQRGIDQIVGAVRPTLGPRPRLVAIDRSDAPPELLDDGGLIARRIIALPGRSEDMGAMYARHLLWRQHEAYGDGTATMALIFQHLFHAGVRAVAAGNSAVALGHHLEEGLELVVSRLEEMAQPVKDEAALTKLARTLCHDDELAAMLGEIFHIVGQFGRLEVRSGRGRSLEREYVEGMYWDSTPLSRQMLDAGGEQLEMENAAILISDLHIDDQQKLLSLLAMVLKEQIPALLIVAAGLSDAALGLLNRNRDPNRLRVAAVHTPGEAAGGQAAALDDLAVLSGGRPLLKAAGQTLGSLRPQDLGHARRVWVDRATFGIVGGQGDPHELREHIARLRKRWTCSEDAARRRQLQRRIGKLLGGSATLRVGGVTGAEIGRRKALAERTAQAMRQAVSGGVLPGAGTALLKCQPALQARRDEADTTDARAAYHMLMEALAQPARTVIANAGYDAGEMLARARLAGTGCAFDVVREEIVDASQAGILDVAPVQRGAVMTAVRGAALALTVDVLVQRRSPERVYEP